MIVLIVINILAERKKVKRVWSAGKRQGSSYLWADGRLTLSRRI